jgi:hypothetical protein
MLLNSWRQVPAGGSDDDHRQKNKKLLETGFALYMSFQKRVTKMRIHRAKDSAIVNITTHRLGLVRFGLSGRMSISSGSG